MNSTTQSLEARFAAEAAAVPEADPQFVAQVMSRVRAAQAAARVRNQITTLVLLVAAALISPSVAQATRFAVRSLRSAMESIPALSLGLESSLTSVSGLVVVLMLTSGVAIWAARR